MSKKLMLVVGAGAVAALLYLVVAGSPPVGEQAATGTVGVADLPADAFPDALPAPTAAAEPVWRDVDGQPLPLRTDAEVSEFLRTASIVESEKTEHGKFGVRKVRLEQDGMAIHAAYRTFVEEKRSLRLKGRDVRFFRDHYIHEPAAYALSELLHLEMVPPAVERRVKGKGASLQIWVEGAMPAIERRERGIQPPDQNSYLLQIYQMRVFDNLINNIDRNQGNILWDSDWRLWLIDHSRAFIRDPKLPEPDGIRRIERGFWERLRSVSDDELKAALEPYIEGPELLALFERRRQLVELIEKKISLVGEDGVLFSRDLLAPSSSSLSQPRKTSGRMTPAAGGFRGSI